MKDKEYKKKCGCKLCYGKGYLMMYQMGGGIRLVDCTACNGSGICEWRVIDERKINKVKVVIE